MLEAFYEFWQDPKWPYAKTKPVPGIFIAFEAGVASKKDLGGRSTRDYPNSPLHRKIAPVLMEMIEKGWIKPIEGGYGDCDDYNYFLWSGVIVSLCGTWTSDAREMEEFKRMESTTSDKFPEVWCFYLTSKGREHFESIGTTTQFLVDELLELQEKINEKLGCELFIDKWKIIDDLRKSSTFVEQYTHRIQNLNLLINKMRIKELEGTGNQTVKFIEDYLRDNNKNSMAIVQNLRDISIISSGYPRHEGSGINKRVNAILNKWGFKESSIDYRNLWETSLRKYVESLKNFLKVLT